MLKVLKKFIFLLFFFYFLLSFSDNLFARNYVIIGPSAGWLAGESAQDLVFSFDLTYAHIRKERSSQIHFFDKIIWFSGGFRYYNTLERVYLPYCEAGIWFIANIGFGYSYGFGNSEYDGNNYHLFFGVPLPAILLQIKVPVFIEPYYRPTWSTQREKVIHEIGLLIKKAYF